MSEDNIYYVNNNSYRKVNIHKKPKENKKFAKDDSDDDIKDFNVEEAQIPLDEYKFFDIKELNIVEKN